MKKNEAPRTYARGIRPFLRGSGIPRSRKGSIYTTSLRSWFSAKGDKLINPPFSFFKAALFALAFIFFLAGQANFSLAQTATAPTPSASSATAKTPNQHYFLTLIWDSTSNTLSLKNGTNPELTTTSLTKDSGTGSQFYAMLANAQGKFAISSKTKSPKYYLGKWELPSGQKQGEIKITVPYLATGVKLIIADAKTDKTALLIDISKLSHPVTAPVANKTTAVPAQAKLQTSQTSNKSAIWGWVIIAIIILILGGGGYWLYRFYKKRKNAKTLTSLEPPSAPNQI